MDRLHGTPRGERAPHRPEAMSVAGHGWLAAQCERAGFRLVGPARADGYDQVRVRRGRGRSDACFSVLDLEGVLEVDDPALFLKALARGFGKAKAWGCGLMLIRRA